MKRTLCLLLLLPLALPAVAGDAADTAEQAREILKKADAAIKTVTSVRLTARSKPEGMAVNFMQPAEGRSLLVGWAGGIPQKFHTHVKTTRSGSDEPVELTGGGDGETYFVIDHKDKKAYEDMDPGVLGTSGTTLQSVSMPEFVHDHPFDDELKAEHVSLHGEETVAGEPCWKIEVDYGGGNRSMWYFSKKDNLPRRRTRVFNVGGQEGSIDNTITRLEIAPAYEPSLFKLKLPEGYEQIDDFAP